MLGLGVVEDRGAAAARTRASNSSWSFVGSGGGAGRLSGLLESPRATKDDGSKLRLATFNIGVAITSVIVG